MFKKQTQIVVYSSESSLSNPGRMIKDMFFDLVGSQNLALRLAIRDISAQYRGAILGFTWMLITPIANTLAWLFLAYSGIIATQATSVPYPIYIFIGTMLWSIFIDSLNAPLTSVTASKAILSKINFPREAILISGVYQVTFNAFIKLAIILSVLIIFDVPFHTGTLLAPFGIFLIILFGTTLGILITPLGVLFEDVGRAVPLLAQFLLFITPVTFAIPKDGFAHYLLTWNPLTPLITTSRDLLLNLPLDQIPYLGIIMLVTFCFLFIFGVIFRLSMPIIIERMSA